MVKKVKRLATGAVRVAREVGLDFKAAQAASMLLDPCNATLSEACYRGDSGYRNRFVFQSSYGAGTGQTAVAIVFVPGTNYIAFIAATSSTTPTNWIINNGPGNTFLQANTGSIRSLGACVSTTPVAANLATSGQVYTSIVPVSALGNISVTGSTTVDALSQLCNRYGKVSIDTPMETKFIPGALDEQYATPQTIPTDVSDCNAILQVFIGLPAATGVVCRFTNIIEWKPFANLGIVSESYMGNPSKNTIEHVKQALVKKNPNWWSNVGSMAYSVLRGYVTGGAVGAIGAAMKSVKFN